MVLFDDEAPYDKLVSVVDRGAENLKLLFETVFVFDCNEPANANYKLLLFS